LIYRFCHACPTIGGTRVFDPPAGRSGGGNRLCSAIAANQRRISVGIALSNTYTKAQRPLTKEA